MTDSRLHQGRLGVLYPIHPDLRELIDKFGFFHIVRGSNFDAAAAYFVNCRVGEFDWSQSSLGTPFYHYDWANGHVVTFSETIVPVRRGGHTVLGKRPAKKVMFYNNTAAIAKVSAFFREVDGVPPNDASN